MSSCWLFHDKYSCAQEEWMHVRNIPNSNFRLERLTMPWICIKCGKRGRWKIRLRGQRLHQRITHRYP